MRTVAIEPIDAAPYQFHRLAVAAPAITVPLIERAAAWYHADPLLFPYRGGRVVADFFPNFSEELGQALAAVIAGDQEKKVEFVLRILRSYNGQEFLQPICKEIVAHLPEDDPPLSEVDVILSSTSVVTGEFGFVQAFAQRYIRSLDRQIAVEQRRSEESPELRKREYGDLDALEE